MHSTKINYNFILIRTPIHKCKIHFRIILNKSKMIKFLYIYKNLSTTWSSNLDNVSDFHTAFYVFSLQIENMALHHDLQGKNVKGSMEIMVQGHVLDFHTAFYVFSLQIENMALHHDLLFWVYVNYVLELEKSDWSCYSIERENLLLPLVVGVYSIIRRSLKCLWYFAFVYLRIIYLRRCSSI